ncbi:MAG: hypothetical protein LUO89_14075 [Methanothrix sp.]|nr:hypothetical protein [Methanothrix sp.]
MMREMPDDSTVSCYDDHSKACDTYQSAVIPCCDDMLDLVARTCRRYLAKNPLVLDLGCGTGNASIALLKRFPSQEARIFLLDGSKQIAHLREQKEVPYYCSKGEKMNWWKEAGFRQVNVLWQYLCIALMAGRKPF